MIMSPDSINISITDLNQTENQKESINKNATIPKDQLTQSPSIGNSPGKSKKHHSKALQRQSAIKDNESPALSSTSTAATSQSISKSSPSFFSRIFSRVRPRNINTRMSQLTEQEELEMGEKSRQMVAKLRRSSSFNLDDLQDHDNNLQINDATLDQEGDLRITQATPTLDVMITSEVSILKEAYNDLLEMAQEAVEDRLKLERILAQSTRLENLDDLDLAEQYLKSMAETLEVSRRELSKLTSVTHEAKESFIGERPQQEQSYNNDDLGLVLGTLKPNEQVILTRMDADTPFEDGIRIISVDGQLYSITKKIIEDNEAHVLTSPQSTSSSNGLISINTKLAQDLSLAQKRVIELEQAQNQEQSLRQATVTELHNQVTALHHQLSMAKLAVERYAQDKQALLDRLKIYEDNADYGNKRHPKDDVRIGQGVSTENLLPQFEKDVDEEQNQPSFTEDNRSLTTLKQRVDSLQQQLDIQQQALMKELDRAEDLAVSLQTHSNSYDHVRAVYLTFLLRPELREQTTILLKEMFEYNEKELQTGQIMLQQSSRHNNTNDQQGERSEKDNATEQANKLIKDNTEQENDEQHTDLRIDNAATLQEKVLANAGNSLTYNI